MVLQTDDRIRLTCMCCMDMATEKPLVDIYMNYRDGSTVTLIHSCPSCGKETKSVYTLFSQGPLKKGTGYQFKQYQEQREDLKKGLVDERSHQGQYRRPAIGIICL